MPVYGTCAGAIILSKKVIQEEGDVTVDPLGLFEVDVQRNAYGRQTESFEVDIPVEAIGGVIRAASIRAPIIVRTGQNVDILACCRP